MLWFLLYASPYDNILALSFLLRNPNEQKKKKITTQKIHIFIETIAFTLHYYNTHLLYFFVFQFEIVIIKCV